MKPFRTLLLALAALAASAALAPAASAQDPAAVQAATEGYAALERGDAAAAARAAQRAVDLAPENLEWRLLLVDALLRGQRPADAFAALTPVRDVADYRVQTRLAEAAVGAGMKAEAADAYGAAARLAADDDARAYLTRARVMTLLELDRRDEAAADFERARQAGVFTGRQSIDTAMLAIAVGDDRAALEAFREAERTEPLSGRIALDAGYAARRLGRDADAVRWLRTGLETLPADAGLTPQRRHEIGREIETLERRWGASLSIDRGVASTAGAATPGAETVTQAGAEVWRRLGGYRNGRPLDLFARVYVTADTEFGGPTGGDTAQGWVGVRWKPLSQANLVLEASRMIALGDLARDDTMLRASWSTESGGDLRHDRTSWPMWRAYVDVARIVDAEQTLGVADGRAGRTWRLTDSDLLDLGLGVRVYYDSFAAEETAIGAGPRLTWRRWFRRDGAAAPASRVEFGLGYDFSLSGDDRSRGLWGALSLIY